MKKILLLTYEFTYSPFSGNGILARTLTKSFLGLGCAVTVWCCRPSLDFHDTHTTASTSTPTSPSSSDNHLALPELSHDAMERFELLSNFVPSDGWRRVDDQSCWRDFTVSNLLPSDVDRLQAALSDADTICVIDWSGAVAYRSILEHRKQQQQLYEDDQIDAAITSKFHLYLNFRVFSFGVADPRRRDWYNEMEQKAMKNANAVVSLSSQDSQQLSAILQKSEETKTTVPHNPRIPIKIVLPPLRQEMEIFAKSGSTPKDFLLHLPNSMRSRIMSSDNTTSGTTLMSNLLLSKRPIIACVARQSPEKCIQRFVTFIEMAADVLQELNLTVVLAGAASDMAYAKNARERLRKAVPSAIVIDRFLSSNELGAVFAHTILNFHPSFYDAYGMTIVEAAAFGAPTVVAGPSIGAFRLLGEDGCLRVAMEESDETVFSESSLDTIVNFLRECQTDTTIWERLSSTAREKALAWNEQSYGERLLQIIDDSCTNRLE